MVVARAAASCGNYSKAEWRSGIWLEHSNGVTLRGLTVVESGGDGVYIADVNNTHIVDCVFDRNYRQGMSVIAAVNLTVERTVFSRYGNRLNARQWEITTICI